MIGVGLRGDLLVPGGVCVCERERGCVYIGSALVLVATGPTDPISMQSVQQ